MGPKILYALSTNGDHELNRIFMTKVSVILAVYISVYSKPHFIYKNHKFCINRFICYWFLQSPAIPVSCFHVQIRVVAWL